MRVNNFFTLVLFLSTVLSAEQIGSIGYIAPEYPPEKIIKRSVSSSQRAELDDFFYDFMELAYDNYGDAAVSVINKLNYKRESVQHKDITYKNTILVPTDDLDTQDIISAFYHDKTIKTRENLAKDNHVDTLIYSGFMKTSFKSQFKKYRRAKRNRKSFPKELVLKYKVSVFDAQTNASKNEFIDIEIHDLFGIPDYDPAVLQAKFENSYINIFQNVFAQLGKTGSAYKSNGEPINTDTPSSSSADVTQSSNSSSSAAVSSNEDEIKKDSSVGGDDW